jgi:preprotein translocase subunit SecB
MRKLDMAEDNAAPAALGNAGTSPAPTFNIIGQYIRDLSFENPGAPASIMAGAGSPQIAINVNRAVKKQTDDVYAVELTLTAKAEREGNVVFNVELVYGGVFRLRNVPENQLAPLLMIECPRLIFPFARQVLASTIQQGGFPPVMVEPIDFQAMYLAELRNLQQQQKPSSAGAAPAPQATPDRLKN